MKKLKIIQLLFLCSVIALILPATVNAHPGGTDANGGHYDRSTGEYHYHHGYSAHNHYDMDGDGDIDCPFDFEVKPRKPSGSGNSGAQSSILYSDGYDDGHDRGIIAGRKEGYALGYDDGYSAGRAESYSVGFDDGKAVGYQDAEADLKEKYDILMDEAASKAVREGFVTAIVICAMVGFFITMYVSDGIGRERRKYKADLETALGYLESEKRKNKALVAAHKKPKLEESNTVIKNPPTSSVIAEIDYKDGVLQVKFTTGGIYQYFNVPESVYMEMMFAQSQGRFFHENINGKYPYGVIR